MYYYGARYYDARTSRWISTDPILEQYLPITANSDKARDHNMKLPGLGGVFNSVNLNLYHYAGNNPINLIDPDGRASYILEYEWKGETKFAYMFEERGYRKLNAFASFIPFSGLISKFANYMSGGHFHEIDGNYAKLYASTVLDIINESKDLIDYGSNLKYVTALSLLSLAGNFYDLYDAYFGGSPDAQIVVGDRILWEASDDLEFLKVFAPMYEAKVQKLIDSGDVKVITDSDEITREIKCTEQGQKKLDYLYKEQKVFKKTWDRTHGR